VLAIKYFRVSAASINWLSLIFMAVYIPGSILANILLEYFGFKSYLFISTGFNIVGSWIRIVGSYDYTLFPLLFAGQTLCAICQCFIFSAPNIIAAVWFPDTERTMCVSIATIMNQLGAALGYLLSPILITKDNYHDRFIFISIIQSIIVTASGIAFIITFEEKPSSPPSLSAELKILQRKLEKKQSVDIISIKKKFYEAIAPLKSMNFWILMHAIGTCQGVYGAVMTLLDQIIEPYGYTTTDAGWFGFCMLAASLPMIFLAGYIIDKTKFYSLSAKANAALLTLSYLLLILSFEIPFLQRRPIVYLTCSLFGSFCSSAFPVYLETGVEITYPVSEGLSSSYQIIATQLYGVIITVLMTAMFESKLKKYTLWASLGFCCFTTLITLMFQGKMKRTELEQMAQESKNQNSINQGKISEKSSLL
jgi:FLVCR family feline leukemia virus subgroup C receptor-related protein